jgi:hypothetical protein
MTIRTRKFVGAIALLAFVAVYALAAMMVAVVLQVNGSKLAELIYYPVAGLLWVLPAMWLVKWMQRPDA